MTRVFLLTFEYSDKSGFHVCGVTDNRIVAVAWFNAGDGHKVYPLTVNDLKPWDRDAIPWTETDAKEAAPLPGEMGRCTCDD